MLRRYAEMTCRIAGMLSVFIVIGITNFAWAEDTFTFQALTSEGTALSGLKIYAFTESDVYTGKSSTTDESGTAVFDISDLTDGIYKFRLDYIGQRIWSDNVVIPNETSVTITIQQANVPVVVGSSYGVMAGYQVYVFTCSGSYMNLNQTTDESGQAVFGLPVGAEYKFRADYMGYQFWSDAVTIQPDTIVDLVIPEQDVAITVQSLFDIPLPMAGVRVYLFTASGSYMNQNQDTDENGMVTFRLPEMGYKVRADYLGMQYWSGEIIWQDTEIAIPMADAEVFVSGSGLPLSNINVYVFDENNSYLGISGTTDSNGIIVFRLPAAGYKFRADYQGSQYWGTAESLAPGQVNPVAISTGGGSFELNVLKAGDFPLSNVNCYVFNESGAYLGLTGITNSEGQVSFNLSDGNYKFRVDYLGYQFWSDLYIIPGRFSGEMTIGHQNAAVTVNTGYQDTMTPLTGAKVYLFTAAGAYLNQNMTTDSTGQAVFSLPEKAYKVRVDYMNLQFWSEEIMQQDTGIIIPMAEAEIIVSGSGQPLASTPVYVFTGSGSYLNLTSLTDEAGNAVFRLPSDGTYKFRADYQGSQYFTSEVSLLPDQGNAVEISTGGGTFSLTVLKGTDEPLSDINVYVFSESGSYLGLTAATNSQGLASFNLADGHYQFRMDYLGYQFWSNVYEVPVTLADTYLIPHQETAITVTSEYQGTSEPLPGVAVYLFTQAGAYMNRNQTTDTDGRVVFSLPEKAYKVRANYMQQQFWSEDIIWQDRSIGVPMAEAEVNVSEYGLPLENVPVYVFRENGAYLSVSGVTDIDGIVSFRLPEAAYKFRADFQGEQYWSNLERLVADERMIIHISNIITWAGIWGDDESEKAYYAVQTQDGGYVIAGDIQYDKSDYYSYDMLLMKFDVYGNVSWQTTLGSTGYDTASCVQQTNDGGFILSGSSRQRNSYSDALIIKTDSSGQTEWEKYFGNDRADNAYFIRQTDDNGYIVAGATTLTGHFYTDIWLLKIDSNGNEVWQKTFGSGDPDVGLTVIQTSDSGYLIGGRIGSSQYCDGGTCYYYKGKLIKTDQNGQSEWSYTLGMEESSNGFADVRQTSDNGFISVLTGRYLDGFGALVKLDEYGAVEWINTLTDSRTFSCKSAEQTEDNGYIVAGQVGGVTDIKILKTDPNGAVEWEKYFDGGSYEHASSVNLTQDGGYIVTGYQYDISQNDYDVILIKTDAQGNAPSLSE